MNERGDLTVLDERMREASAELRRAIEAAIGDASTGLAPVVRLDTSPSTHRRRRRWLWAAAAAVIVVAGVAGVIIVGRGGDEDTPPATTVDPQFLVPGWLPPDWSPLMAARADEQPAPASQVTVYGTSSADDLWGGDIVSVLRTPFDESFAEEPTTVEVAGRDAEIEGRGDMWLVGVPLDGRQVVVSGRGVTRAVVLRVATAAVQGSAIEPVLPSGMTQLAEGSIQIPFMPAEGELSLVYGRESAEQSVTITQRPGGESELGLIRVILPALNTMQQITVRGQPGVRIRPDSQPGTAVDVPGFVQWVEPPGLLVTMWGSGVGDEDLDRIIEELRPSTDREIDELVEQYAQPPEATDDLREGEFLVTEGDRGPNHWRVTAREAGGSFEVFYEDDTTGSSGLATESSRRGAPELAVSVVDESDDRGEVAVIGMADPAIVDVVVETADQPPLPLRLYEPDELTHKVVVGFVPERYLPGKVVGRNAHGREIACEHVAIPSTDEGDSAQAVPSGCE